MKIEKYLLIIGLLFGIEFTLLIGMTIKENKVINTTKEDSTEVVIGSETKLRDMFCEDFHIEYDEPIFIDDFNNYYDWFIYWSGELEIVHYDIVYCQSLLETGHLKSYLYKEYKNLFGMRRAKNRETTQDNGINDYLNYGHYSCALSSLIDYKLWQDKYCSHLDKESYLEYLGQVYSEDPNYVSKIKKMLKKM